MSVVFEVIFVERMLIAFNELIRKKIPLISVQRSAINDRPLLSRVAEAVEDAPDISLLLFCCAR